jgi:hypothetical protein
MIKNNETIPRKEDVQMETLLTKLMIIATLVAMAPILIKIGNVWLMQKLTKEKAYANYNKQKSQELQQKKIKQQLELEDILLRKEVEPYYETAKDLFNNAIKSGNLNREQILYLKKVINDSLGDYLKDFQYTRFQNDAHEIYSKLKSSHISINSFKKIIQLIKAFEAQTCKDYITVIK